MKKSVLLGAHMSIAGGIEQAFYRGAAIGCTAIQIFTHSPRQWKMSPIAQKTIDAVALAQKETGILQSLSHANYLINLGSSSSETVKKSIDTLKKELQNCHALSIPYLVLHPGSSSKTKKASLNQIGETLSEIIESDQGNTILLLENMAGQGNQTCAHFDELAYLRSKISLQEKVGFCIDTCHLWAAGYNFSTEESYQETMEELDSTIGLSHLKALHLNDSKHERGSRRDRHEAIGEGTIGLQAFRLIMNDERLKAVPKVVETPEAEDGKDMKTLLSLIKK